MANPNLGDYKKDYWTDRVKPKLALIEGWARNGLSNVQIATNLGIGTTTFDRFLREHEELPETLKSGREDAEVVVENALYKRASGYTATEVTKERVKQYDDDGEWTGKYVMVTTRKITKHFAPDVTAAVYWLEHRAPKRWEKTPQHGLDTDIINETISSLAELIRRPTRERKIGSENE